MLLSSNLSKIGCESETRPSQVHVKRSSPASQHHRSPHISSKRATDFPSFLPWGASILPSCCPTTLPGLCWHSGQSVQRRANLLAQVPLLCLKEKRCLLKMWTTNLEELLDSNMGAIVEGKIILKIKSLLNIFWKWPLLKAILQWPFPANLISISKCL